MKKLIICLFVFLNICIFNSHSQEVLKSFSEDYYSFLDLCGYAQSSTLNYRTLSDNYYVVNSEDTNFWHNNKLESSYNLNEKINLRLYELSWVNSFNTASPYGQNDGGFWQGKGYNTLFSCGLRLEAYGFEATFLPNISFSQNLEFDYIKPNYTGTNYEGKANLYGYYGLRNLDCPQRFGDSQFWNFDFGETEIRYSYKNITMGFGTQNIWLGPAQINPIIHSNNAQSYPKLDIGLRKQNINIKNIDFGTIEFRLWWGKLTESDYFDNNQDNNNNLISAICVAYRLPFLEDLTLAINRTMISKWADRNFFEIFRMFDFGMSSDMGTDVADQRASIVIDWKLKKSQTNIYVEWAKNDYSPDYDFIIRYPFHQAGYTFGMRQALHSSKKLKGELTIEFTKLECSRDYDLIFGGGGATFYAHGLITQGYTNRGQWLGAGIGTGGNSQLIGYKLYYPKGCFQFYIQRRNPDLDYTFYIDAKNDKQSDDGHWVIEENIRAMMIYGIKAYHYITPQFLINGEFAFVDEHNPLNKSTPEHTSAKRYNCYINTSFKYLF